HRLELSALGKPYTFIRTSSSRSDGSARSTHLPCLIFPAAPQNKAVINRQVQNASLLATHEAENTISKLKTVLACIETLKRHADDLESHVKDIIVCKKARRSIFQDISSAFQLQQQANSDLLFNQVTEQLDVDHA
ncbi:hypothetical protein HK096_006995, partial [Nowakowskiella sp. JEL0078]